jgi:hypothetical protein
MASGILKSLSIDFITPEKNITPILKKTIPKTSKDVTGNSKLNVNVSRGNFCPIL